MVGKKNMKSLASLLENIYQCLQEEERGWRLNCCSAGRHFSFISVKLFRFTSQQTKKGREMGNFVSTMNGWHTFICINRYLGICVCCSVLWTLFTHSQTLVSVGLQYCNNLLLKKLLLLLGKL